MADNNQPASEMNERQSQLATVLIGVLIVVAGFLIYTVFNNQGPINDTDDLVIDGEPTPTQTEPTERDEESEPTPETTDEPTGGLVYRVQEGDTLWSIAQEAYGDGYQWRVIADENNIPLTDTGLEVDDEIFIPAIGGPGDEEGEPTPEPTAAEEEEEPTPTEEAEPAPTPEEDDETDDEEEPTDQPTDTTTYTVQRGDTLWSIAQRHYGDGHQWRTIFDAPENDIVMYTSRTTGQTYPLINPGDVLTIPALN